VKDLLTGTVILRCNSSGPLYPICQPSHEAQVATSSTSFDVWHRRLGHPGSHIMTRLHQLHHIPSNKASSSLCNACQLGKHIRSPFFPSQTFTSRPFECIHCDLWTSPVPNTSGYRYYIIIVDDFSNYFWTFPLCRKSDVYTTFLTFHAYVSTYTI
jgi:histone deacetylase 1/2